MHGIAMSGNTCSLIASRQLVSLLGAIRDGDDLAHCELYTSCTPILTSFRNSGTMYMYLFLITNRLPVEYSQAGLVQLGGRTMFFSFFSWGPGNL